VSTLGEMIHLHQFQFNHILIFFSNHCYSLCISAQLFTCIFVVSQYQKDHTDNSAAGQALTISIKNLLLS